MVDHIVGNINEAVKLSLDWKEKNHNYWFRGQAKPWPLQSTLVRAQKRGMHEQELEKIKYFDFWLKEQPDLRHLLYDENEYEYFAILQHYGVSTYYIDFTTNPEIAGFFATDGPDVVPAEQGCIICIDPDKMTETLRLMAKEYFHFSSETFPEKVEVDVSNLWRLQAQAGVFLYLQYTGVENYYDYNRILFTHESSNYFIPITRIYPKNKSALEQRMDEFFQGKKQNDWRKIIDDVLKNSTLSFKEIGFKPDSEDEYLRAGTSPHDSWLHIHDEWEKTPRGDFHELDKENINVSISHFKEATAKEIKAIALDEIKQFLGENPNCRNKFVKWKFKVSCSQQVHTSNENDLVSSSLERIWDGMRILPYTNEQIATALATLLALFSDNTILQPLQKIELVSAQEVISITIVEIDDLISTFRPDLISILSQPSKQNNPLGLLISLRPQYLFDFDKLVGLFANWIVPLQVFLKAKNGQSGGALFFSPPSVKKIGPKMFNKPDL